MCTYTHTYPPPPHTHTQTRTHPHTQVGAANGRMIYHLRKALQNKLVYARENSGAHGMEEENPHVLAFNPMTNLVAVDEHDYRCVAPCTLKAHASASFCVLMTRP